MSGALGPGPPRRRGRVGGRAAISTVAVLGYLGFLGFLGGRPLFGAVAGATSLRGGFVFLAAMAVLVAAASPVLGRDFRS